MAESLLCFALRRIGWLFPVIYRETDLLLLTPRMREIQPTLVK